jgi:hypothetical protein
VFVRDTPSTAGILRTFAKKKFARRASARLRD